MKIESSIPAVHACLPMASKKMGFNFTREHAGCINGAPAWQACVVATAVIFCVRATACDVLDQKLIAIETMDISK
jgi:hypothetical protein